LQLGGQVIDDVLHLEGKSIHIFENEGTYALYAIKSNVPYINMAMFLVLEVDGAPIGNTEEDLNGILESLNPDKVLTVINSKGIEKLSREIKRDITREIWDLPNSIELLEGGSQTFHNRANVKRFSKIFLQAKHLALSSLFRGISRIHVTLPCSTDKQMRDVLALDPDHKLRSRDPGFFKMAQQDLYDQPRLRREALLNELKRIIESYQDFAQEYPELFSEIKKTLPANSINAATAISSSSSSST
jgi:hypothetical protein